MGAISGWAQERADLAQETVTSFLLLRRADGGSQGPKRLELTGEDGAGAAWRARGTSSWGSLSCPHSPLRDKGLCAILSAGTSPTPNLGVVKMLIKDSSFGDLSVLPKFPDPEININKIK